MPRFVILPRAACALVAMLAWLEAGAFQVGQLTAVSRLGEPLAARVELYGVTREEAARLALELRPAIGSAPDGAARRAVDGISASVATDVAGSPYVELRSRAPMTLAELPFRLRVGLGAEARITHHELVLQPSAAAPRAGP